jgi:hypothetical protein
MKLKDIIIIIKVEVLYKTGDIITKLQDRFIFDPWDRVLNFPWVTNLDVALIKNKSEYYHKWAKRTNKALRFLAAKAEKNAEKLNMSL